MWRKRAPQQWKGREAGRGGMGNLQGGVVNVAILGASSEWPLLDNQISSVNGGLCRISPPL